MFPMTTKFELHVSANNQLNTLYRTRIGHYNLPLLRKLRSAVNTIMSHLQGYAEAGTLKVELASRVINCEIPVQEYEDYYFRLEIGETWYPDNDAALVALAERKCSNAC